jgi:hypothetical protein
MGWVFDELVSHDRDGQRGRLGGRDSHACGDERAERGQHQAQSSAGDDGEQLDRIDTPRIPARHPGRECVTHGGSVGG